MLACKVCGTSYPGVAGSEADIRQENEWKIKLKNFTIGARDERTEVKIVQIIINSKQKKSNKFYAVSLQATTAQYAWK